MYVCPSGLGGNTIFSIAFFLVNIPIIYEHLFYKYFVRRSVDQATKGKMYIHYTYRKFKSISRVHFTVED